MLKLAGEFIEGQLADHKAALDAHTRNPLEIMAVNRYLYSPVVTGPNLGGAAALTANTLYAVPYPIIRAGTPDQIAIDIQAADAVNPNLRIGLFNDDGTVYPGARLSNGGVVSVATTGTKTVAYTTPFAKKLIWIVFIADGTPSIYYASAQLPLLGSASNVRSTDCVLYKAGAYGDLPDPFPSGAYYTGWQIAVGLRFTSWDLGG